MALAWPARPYRFSHCPTSLISSSPSLLLAYVAQPHRPSCCSPGPPLFLSWHVLLSPSTLVSQLSEQPTFSPPSVVSCHLRDSNLGQPIKIPSPFRSLLDHSLSFDTSTFFFQAPLILSFSSYIGSFQEPREQAVLKPPAPSPTPCSPWLLPAPGPGTHVRGPRSHRTNGPVCGAALLWPRQPGGPPASGGRWVPATSITRGARQAPGSPGGPQQSLRLLQD